MLYGRLTPQLELQPRPTLAATRLKHTFTHLILYNSVTLTRRVIKAKEFWSKKCRHAEVEAYHPLSGEDDLYVNPQPMFVRRVC